MSNVSQEEPCDVLVLLATQSFTGEALVEDVLLEKFACFHVQVKLVDEVFQVDTSQHPADDRCYWPDEMVRSSSHHRPVLLFVVSTFGDGEPPNHALEFASWLSRQPQQSGATTTTQNIGFPYAVFGLGDRTYQHFAAFGSFVDSHLEKLGGQRLSPLQTGDKAGGDQAGDFERWCDCILRKLGTTKEAFVATGRTASHHRRVYPFPSGTGADWFRSVRQESSVVQAKVVEARELIEKESDTSLHQQRSVFHFSLLLSSDCIPADLQLGDHVGVYPRNHRTTVQKALDWLGLQGDTTTSILEKSKSLKWERRELTAWEFLSEHVDIASRATPEILRSMVPFVGTLELRALARELTHVDSEANSIDATDPSSFDAWIAGRRLAALDLVILFECRPSLQGLARICGPLQPRLYSVASVDHTFGVDDYGSTFLTTVGLTVAVAEGGLCSNYMADVGRKGGELSVFCRPSPFRYSLDQAPVLLVAAGSGVGTCLGFVEEILKQSKMKMQDDPPLSNVHLFFGCRTTSELLYGERLTTLTNSEIGLNLHLALSRMPTVKKTYVQDLIVDEAASVWRSLFEAGGSMYVCGRLELLAGVKIALAEVAKVFGSQNSSSAEQLVKRFIDSGKFKSDCWSVGTHTEASVPQRKRKHAIVRLERHHERKDHQVALEPRPDLSSVPIWPSYLRLLASGELERRVDRANDMQSACVACGRMCETNRLSDNPEDWGECRVGNQSIVYSAFPHFGEEDCLVGSNGSGTIFFGACNLKCMYCQNWEISAMDQGEIFSDDQLAQTMLNLQIIGCHNINFVSPTHNVAAILRATLIAANKGLRLPLVWNTGGYDSVASLRLLEGIIDIYMPDSKYASRAVARKLSSIDNYPEINQAALKEMHRQVGELQIDPDTGLARRGVLVRHLVLPCDLAGTCDVMGFLAKEISKETYTNVMDQYRPEHKAVKDKKFGLARKPTRNELRVAREQARDAGVTRFDSEYRSLQW